MSQWRYQDKPVDEIPDEYEGFVYLITNLTNGRKYIGKKLAKFKTSKPPLKGKKNRRRGYKESDWRDYWSSSDKLQADVEELGQENFSREILYFCTSRAEMSYRRMKDCVWILTCPREKYTKGFKRLGALRKSNTTVSDFA